ncbi:sucrase ferredoxin [Microlunatus capsulatus]|uniref:sucrase ferredoxin n=1 Tax=Microlunatus capsulatus TaxID=99117 RepID=UPI0031D701B1
MSLAPAPSWDGGPPRCADAAELRGDAGVGTAPPAARWLLLEHPGPWAVDAVPGSGVDPAVLVPLGAAAARSATRILLVRRPGRRPAPERRTWLLSGPGLGTVEGRWRTDADLVDAVAALGAPDPDPVLTGPSAPVLLVCAHGVHDTCCAVRGRPVAAALDRAHPGLVWECSHVGGDRFAPNVVVLPDGFYYGGLAPTTAVATVAAHLAGRVETAHLRGMSRYPPVQQAAVVAAHEAYGPLAAGAVVVTDARSVPATGTAGARTIVEMRVAGLPDAVRAEVVAERRPPTRLTCRAARDGVATEYRVERLG